MTTTPLATYNTENREERLYFVNPHEATELKRVITNEERINNRRFSYRYRKIVFPVVRTALH